MSQIEDKSAKNKTASDENLKNIDAKNLENMEALLTEAAKGIHVLFDNKTIAQVLENQAASDHEFYNFDQIKRVQDLMTELISKKNYFEKTAFLENLDRKTHDLVVKAYLHIIENTLKKTQPLKH